MDTKEYSKRLLNGQLGIDVKNVTRQDNEYVAITNYKPLELCPECGGELLLHIIKSRPYKRSRHRMECEHCDYYEIAEPSIEKVIRMNELQDDINPK